MIRFMKDGKVDRSYWIGDEPCHDHDLADALDVAVAAHKEADLQLSRILHEMAGSVSLCWIPKPTGEFDSTLACEYVAAAIEEYRAP